jgi:mannose-6-phosphate isomerase-like protein (cupin superfamily)
MAIELLHSDSVFQVQPGTSPDYDSGNSLVNLLEVMERCELAGERQTYVTNSHQYLFPFDFLQLYGPSGSDFANVDPKSQDNKTDFQKQNVRMFTLTDTWVMRGWASVLEWIGPYIRLSYRAGIDSKLSGLSGHKLGERIKVWVKIGNAPGSIITVPYNPVSDRYEVELWGYRGGSDMPEKLDDKAREALNRGELQIRPDLLPGVMSDFDRGKLEDQFMVQVAPNHAMHPVLPLRLECAWTDESEKFWDSKNGQNYIYEFNMILRGWRNFIGVGTSPNPHGGVGFLEYRNLMSNYGRYAGMNELGREVYNWNFDAYGQKNGNMGPKYERFMAVDYMDLHILKPNCGIGLHRHRDNQEVFFMMDGRGYMVVGDWAKMSSRDRCFEIRTLEAGHFAMLKGGNLHGLMNPSDENMSLFMFGGYD